MPLIDNLVNGLASPNCNRMIRSIMYAAKYHHFDPILAVTIALLESGLNPRAIGDNGNSFGLYQLNRTGELGPLSPQDAMNASLNLHRFLTYAMKFYKPELSPGVNAANIQRPKNRIWYALYINGLYLLVKQVLNGK